MTQWFALNLGDAMLAEAARENIQSVFLNEYEKAGRPRKMAVFQKHVSEGDLHCELVLYFSPVAQRVAHQFGAIPCHNPSSEGIALMAGSPEASEILFMML